MDRVYNPSESGFDQIHHVAIAFRLFEDGSQHIGVIHRKTEANECCFLHLAFHYDLREEAPRLDYYWIDPVIPKPRARQVAAICRQISRSNSRGIPYGFSPPSDCFDEQACEYLLGPGQLGLTCASFVIAIFDRAQYPLLQTETWPVGRGEDKAWQKSIVNLLEEHGAPDSHVDAVHDDIGAVRFRPEEVAGAATLDPLPAPFGRSSVQGKQLVELLGIS